MKLKFTIILTLLCCIKGLSYAQPKCSFAHYAPDDGLSGKTVMSITQDKKGFMWFGTWNGLSKFDGYRFKTYKSTPSDPESLDKQPGRLDY